MLALVVALMRVVAGAGVAGDKVVAAVAEAGLDAVGLATVTRVALEPLARIGGDLEIALLQVR